MRAPLFFKQYVTNVIGGVTDHDFRLEVLNEKFQDGKSWVYVSDGVLILSPIGAKRMFVKLKEMIDAYEKEKGPIDIGPGKKEKGYPPNVE